MELQYASDEVIIFYLLEQRVSGSARENRSLMRIVKQNRFKNLGELHKEWTEAGVKASRATTHRRVKEFGYSCRQRRLTWAKEKKNWNNWKFSPPCSKYIPTAMVQ